MLRPFDVLTGYRRPRSGVLYTRVHKRTRRIMSGDQPACLRSLFHVRLLLRRRLLLLRTVLGGFAVYIFVYACTIDVCYYSLFIINIFSLFFFPPRTVYPFPFARVPVGARGARYVVFLSSVPICYVMLARL